MKNVLTNIVRFGIINYWILFLFVSYVVATKSFESKMAMADTQVGVEASASTVTLAKNEEQVAQKTVVSKNQETSAASEHIQSDTPSPTDEPNTTTQSTPEPTPTMDIFSQVALHNTRNDCWFSYKGHVYNITAYFGSHPGGDQNLLNYCGQNVDVAFDTKGKSPGSPHSAQAVSIFQQYLVQ